MGYHDQQSVGTLVRPLARGSSRATAPSLVAHAEYERHLDLRH